MDKPLIPVILLFHDVFSTALLITISWQTFVVLAPRSALQGFAAANAPAPMPLQAVIAGLFVAVIGLGALLYPAYRFSVRPYLEIHNLRAANGAFEIKEHLAALALMILPAYLAAWYNSASDEALVTRRVITAILCALVWWNFTVGHIMNYIQAPAS